MSYLGKILTGIDRLTHFQLYRDLCELSPKACDISYGKTCKGAQTVFDQATGNDSKDIVSLSIEALGNLSVSDVTYVFLHRLVKEEGKVPVKIPLAKIQAMNASKSDLTKYDSLYDFGKYCYQRFRENHKGLNEQQYFEYCIKAGLREGDTDFDIKLWSPTLRWENAGGSHRFSAAYYVGIEQGYDWTIAGNLRLYSLDHEWLTQVFQVFDTFLFQIDGDIDWGVLFEVFDLHNSKNTMVDIRANYSNDLTNALTSDKINIILLLHKKQRLPRFAKQWLETHLKNGQIKRFNEVVKELQVVEVAARKRMNRFRIG